MAMESDETGSAAATFACPHCAGPLRLVQGEDGGACRRGHAFRIDGVLDDYARFTAQSLWRAVNLLRDRAATSRWAADHPSRRLGQSPEELRATATADDEMADHLRVQARALDDALTFRERGRRRSGTGASDADPGPSSG